MKKFLTFSVFIALGIIFFVNSPKTYALSGSEFQAGRIMDDSVFFNGGSLDPNTIQVFLNSKVPNCDTNGTQAYGGTTRAAYGTSKGYPPPFTCLKNYTQDTPTRLAESGLCNQYNGGVKSAAQIIYDVGVACGVSQKVLIVLLEKEQSLITDDWPWSVQYRSATGYGCPDTAPCDAEYYGFFNQVYNAARQFKKYSRDSTQYRYRAYRDNYIQYNPNTACGGTNVYIQNQATAGLYNYTPYQPNPSALNNLYGSGDGCGAYGNRNFWRMFNDWFGTPLGPDYQWAIESFSYSGNDNLIASGENETVTLKAKNVGRFPWYNHGTNPVRLRTWEPPNRTSALLGAGFYADMQESAVQPGQTGTFQFHISSSQIGTFYESLNLVAENSQWMPWTGLRPTITITSPYQWKIQDVLYEKGTGVMDPGSTQLITLIAQNTGSTTWSKTSGPKIRLGTWQPDRQSQSNYNWISPSRVTEMNENSVAPGQTAGFQFVVRMPGSGPFYEKLNLVAEGITWMNDPGLTLYLYGNSYKWSLQNVQYSSGTGVMNVNSQQTITVKALNTGTATWTNSSSFPVKLGTWQPQRQSIIGSNWPSNTRMSTLVESSVSPGQVGTFTAQIQMPSTGLKYERMNLVAEGLMWLNDQGLTFYLEGR